MTLLITNSDEIYCANVGDSRAVLRTSEGSEPVVELSMDHNMFYKDPANILPFKMIEKKRIEKAGYKIRDGKVLYFEEGSPNADGELLDGTPLSRSIGDYRLKSKPNLKVMD